MYMLEPTRVILGSPGGSTLEEYPYVPQIPAFPAFTAFSDRTLILRASTRVLSGSFSSYIEDHSTVPVTVLGRRPFGDAPLARLPWLPM